MAQIINTVSKSKIKAGANKEWNYHPQLPISLAPFFDSPFNLKASLQWLAATWLKITPPINHLLFAIVVYLFFLPSMASMIEMSWDWITQLFAINFLAITLLASFLHAYLYVFSKQNMKLKFDVRPMEKSVRFTFGHQTWDNIFWTLAASVPIWTAWSVFYFHAAANEWIPTITSFKESPIWFILFFIIIRFWQSFHFYWIHRLHPPPHIFYVVTNICNYSRLSEDDHHF